MSTDGIQNFSGDAELIDGVLRDNDSEEDTYQIDQDNDEISPSDEEDEDDDEDSSVVELGMEKTLDDDVFNNDDAPPSLEDLKAKATREWEREIGSVEIIDDPVRMYLREIGRVDLLRAVEERDLARKFEAKRYVENSEDQLFATEEFCKYFQKNKFNEIIDGLELQMIAHVPQNGSGTIICRAKEVKIIYDLIKMWRESYSISFEIKPALTNQEIVDMHLSKSYWDKS